jgi:hypothetical protein
VALLGLAVLAASIAIVYIAAPGSGDTGGTSPGSEESGGATTRVRATVEATRVAAAPPARAEDPPALGGEDPAHLEALGRRVLPSFVRVAVSLRYDQGVAPVSLAYDDDDLEARARDGRPVWLTGFLLAPGQVLAQDPQIDARFISRITVSRGAESSPAWVTAWATHSAGVFLGLEQPLTQGSPLPFSATATPPYYAVSHVFDDGTWSTLVEPVGTLVHLRESGAAASRTLYPAVVVDPRGTPVGITLDGWLHTNGAWKGSPESWDDLAAAEHARLVEGTRALAARGMLNVTVRLRGLNAADEDRRGRRYRWSEDDGADQAERAALGVLTGPRRLFVLDRMDAKTAARIESIVVHAADGALVPARFVVTFRDFGAYLVEADRDLAGVLTLSRAPIVQQSERLLLGAHVELLGGRRVIHGGSYRLDRFQTGRRGEVVPDVRGPASGEFLFDGAGALVALPVLRRARDKEEDGWRFQEPELLGADHLALLLASPEAHADPSIVPVPIAREGRLAWLGVEVQRLNRDLARANDVSHVTQDGQTGALVSYVYAGSPAHAAGIQPGMVVLRYEVPGQPRPVEVLPPLDRFASSSEDPEELADYEVRLRQSQPGYTPWPSVENALNRTLTAIGIGTVTTLEYAVAGQVRRAPLTVSEGPLHHEAAPRHRSEELGLTVRDLTYEVRRHFRLDERAAGAIVSNVEGGGRAAIAGLRRFDLVLQVNEQAVADGAACARALAGAGELRLTVRDALKQRVVKIAAAPN